MDQLEIILQDEYRLQILRERLVQRGDVRPSAAFERRLRSMLRINRFYPSDALPWYPQSLQLIEDPKSPIIPPR